MSTLARKNCIVGTGIRDENRRTATALNAQGGASSATGGGAPNATEVDDWLACRSRDCAKYRSAKFA